MFKIKKLSLICFLACFILFAEKADAQNITPPEKLLGFVVGADYELARYGQAVEYFRALERESGRIKIYEIGKTSMGKNMIYAVISSEKNMPDAEPTNPNVHPLIVRWKNLIGSAMGAEFDKKNSRARIVNTENVNTIHLKLYLSYLSYNT